ncbi:MAG: hypothetical protein WBO55_12685 [Rhizobiaceae bacterium]
MPTAMQSRFRLFTLSMMVAAAFGLSATGSKAEGIESAYSKFDIDRDCVWDSLDHLSEEERDQMLGNSAVCKGYGDYPVHFSEFDLRQYTGFGPVNEDWRTPGTFGQFNHVGDTIEWRLRNGRPFATIFRWFIENANPSTGEVDKKHEGQVLVISSVAQPDAPEGDRTSCPIGYVDARANANANELARQVADSTAEGFRCGTDLPVFHGKREPLSGNPTSIAE